VRATVAVLLVIVTGLVAACGSQQPSPAPSSPLAVASATPAPSAPPSATPSSTPIASATPVATATAVAAATPVVTPKPTPKPTPVPWKSYTSKKYHYKISYPPTWIVTPGSGTYSDEFDNFVYPYLYVYRDVVPSGYYVAVTKAVNQRVAYFKSHYHASVVSNKSIKVNGWSGRLAILKGKDGVVNIQIQELILAKGRIGYELELMGELDAAAADKALFKRIYSSWHPT
jgi:hypothetical protein